MPREDAHERPQPSSHACENFLLLAMLCYAPLPQQTSATSPSFPTISNCIWLEPAAWKLFSCVIRVLDLKVLKHLQSGLKGFCCELWTRKICLQYLNLKLIAECRLPRLALCDRAGQPPNIPFTMTQEEVISMLTGYPGFQTLKYITTKPSPQAGPLQPLQGISA